MRIIFATLLLMGIIASHLFVAYIFGEPWANINITLGILLVVLFWRETGVVVWLSFFAHLIIELYTLTPFGIILFSGTSAVLFTYWAYVHVFTNKSWFSITILSFLTILFYRSIYMLLLLMTAGLSDTYQMPNIASLLSSIAWELTLTVFFVSFCYGLLSFIFKPTLKLRRKPYAF
jgi:hypothetical protein